MIRRKCFDNPDSRVHNTPTKSNVVRRPQRGTVMKLSRFILVCILVLGLATISLAQTADAVIQRAINAMGGQAAFDNLNSMSLTISGTMMETMEMSMKMWVVKPGKVRMDTNMMGIDIIQATDGTDYWMSSGGQVTDMPEMQKQALSINKDMMTGGGLSNLDAMGITTEYLGKESAGGVEADVVKFTYQNSTSGKWYFSTADGLPFMARMEIGQGEMEMRIAEYKTFGPLKMATQFQMDTPQGAVIMKIDDVQINQPIDATLFTRPQ